MVVLQDVINYSAFLTHGKDPNNKYWLTVKGNLDDATNADYAQVYPLLFFQHMAAPTDIDNYSNYVGVIRFGDLANHLFAGIFAHSLTQPALDFDCYNNINGFIFSANDTLQHLLFLSPNVTGEYYLDYADGVTSLPVYDTENPVGLRNNRYQLLIDTYSIGPTITQIQGLLQGIKLNENNNISTQQMLYSASYAVTDTSNHYEYTWIDGTVVDIVLPVGNYTLTSLTTYIKNLMITNKHCPLDALGTPVTIFEFFSPTSLTGFAATRVHFIPSASTKKTWTIPTGATWTWPAYDKFPQFQVYGNNDLLGIGFGGYQWPQDTAVNSYPTPTSTANGTYSYFDNYNDIPPLIGGVYLGLSTPNLLLDKTTLGSSVVNSSLTSVGTLTSLTVTGTATAGNVNSIGVYRINGVDFVASRNTGSIGVGAGAQSTSTPGIGTTALGNNAGRITQGDNAIAVGQFSGENSQGAGAVAIGRTAGQTTQSSNAVAVGISAGQTTQGSSSVAVGVGAGRYTQGTNAVAIGNSAGTGTTTAGTGQGANAVAVGNSAGQNTQGASAVAVGNTAGNTGQLSNAVAIGIQAGQDTQGASGVAVGVNAGRYTQGGGAIAIGSSAGSGTTTAGTGQGSNAVAVGLNAGNTSQGASAVAIGSSAGNSGQLGGAVAIGFNSGVTTQGASTVAVGQGAAFSGQGTGAVAIGNTAGFTNQATYGIAIGVAAGNSGQLADAVAIGRNAGQNNQGVGAFAFGLSAGQTTQGTGAVALGAYAGSSGQLQNAVAIGNSAGLTSQGTECIAIGLNAGKTSQGAKAIAIGHLAGETSQHANSIILNGSGAALNSDGTSRFYVKPVRQDTTVTTLVGYNSTSGEITYGAVPAAPVISSFWLATNTQITTSNVVQNLGSITLAVGTYLLQVYGTASGTGLTRTEISLDPTSTVISINQQNGYPYDNRFQNIDFHYLQATTVITLASSTTLYLNGRAFSTQLGVNFTCWVANKTGVTATKLG